MNVLRWSEMDPMTSFPNHYEAFLTDPDPRSLAATTSDSELLAFTVNGHANHRGPCYRIDDAVTAVKRFLAGSQCQTEFILDRNGAE